MDNDIKIKYTNMILLNIGCFNGNCNKSYFVNIKNLENIFRMNSFSTLFSVVFAYLTVSTALHVSTTAASIISNPTVLQGKDMPIVKYCFILHPHILVYDNKGI